MPTDPDFWVWVWERGVPLLLIAAVLAAAFIFAKKSK
jgi:hypothetical protein